MCLHVLSFALTPNQSSKVLKSSLALVMEVNTKGSGWGGLNRMREVGGLVRRRAIGRLGVGKSSQKKLGVKGGGKND